MKKINQILEKFRLFFLRLFQNPFSLYWHFILAYYYFRGTDHLLPFYKKIKILNAEKNLDYLIEKKVSFVRFGTGEAHVAMGMEQHGGHTIQKAPYRLMKRMHELFYQDSVLVGVGRRFFSNTDRENKKNGKYNMYLRNRVFLKNKLDPSETYGEAFFFREDFDVKKLLDYINTKTLVIINKKNLEIESLSIGKKKYMIETPAENTFDKYEEIIGNVKKIIKENGFKKENTLFLVAIGVAAKPLVVDIDKMGFVAWDVGALFSDFVLRKIKKFLN